MKLLKTKGRICNVPAFLFPSTDNHQLPDYLAIEDR
jgi:hypothetical protein